MASLSPTSSFDFFAWARVYQTVGLPFLFVPITAAAFAGLPPNKTNDASALINVVRNLGGSIGVSVANTMLVRGMQFHQNQLTDHLVPSSPQYQEALRQATDQLVAHGATTAVARQQAFGLLSQLITTQSTLLSYVDVFAGFAIVALIMVPLAFLLRSTEAQPGHA
jgi:DHA2 family multidrug resistance protein